MHRANNQHLANSAKMTAIVLAAGGVPAALSPFVGRSCGAMLPINGRPIIHWSLSYLQDVGISKAVIGIQETETQLPEFVRQTFGSAFELNFVRVNKDGGPGFTLLSCLRHLAPGSSCLIVLGDTLFQFPDAQNLFEKSFILTSPVEDASRWCLATTDASHHVVALADKPETNPGSWPALVGVYYLADPEPGTAALEALSRTGTAKLELRHALGPYIDSRVLVAYPAAKWYDCGNPDLLTSSRRRLLQARSFNSVQIDELRGTITKRSTHRSKFVNEINYYRLLPPDLITFFPRLVDFSILPENTFLTLEYYGYATLSEIWVFERFDASFWQGVFRSLSRILECFSRNTVELAPASVFSFYWLKTVDRLETFASQSEQFKALLGATQLSCNGEHLKGWPVIQTEVQRRINQVAKRAKGQIIHGDLCFPNILFDPLSRLFKFIDPRGSFGEAGIFGDSRYDLAKLLHSIDGGYDFIIHDMFTLKREGMDITLQLFVPETRQQVLRAFANVFNSTDLMEIRLIEGLLFLSMCPLHADNERRQVAMFVTGLKILNRVIENEDLYRS